MCVWRKREKQKGLLFVICRPSLRANHEQHEREKTTLLSPFSTSTFGRQSSKVLVCVFLLLSPKGGHHFPSAFLKLCPEGLPCSWLAARLQSSSSLMSVSGREFKHFFCGRKFHIFARRKHFKEKSRRGAPFLSQNSAPFMSI